MSLSESYVLCTDSSDGSADFTVSLPDDDHKFSASTQGNTAVVEYEETLSWRGRIRVSEPNEEVFKTLMQSKVMTQFLEDNDLDSVRREFR